MRVAYQPIVCMDRGRIRGFEALLRWDSPELGAVEPSEFIPIAEQTGLIVPIGAWVLNQAVRELASLRRERPDLDLSMTVNVSARQVLDPGLPRLVRTALRNHDVPPASLALEITESDLVDDAVSVLESLSSLRRLGVRLLLDDFGTGFSSLGYLKRFPVDGLKIDRAFVDGLGRDAGDRAIVSAIIGVARALDVDVIGEGVETPEQARELAELGCPMAQGFLFARPVFEPAALLDANLLAA
jgi:EAL domain-containing protein (putative c-di-GMP-specific phosphodiesterase class I)